MNAQVSQPSISVIVPVYNAEKWLERCVKSVLKQTFNDFELILVNDGSKDGSGRLCDNLSKIDSRIKVLHQPNAGPNAARNLGIKTSSGMFIIFADADDEFYSPDTLELNIQPLLDNPDIDIVSMPQYREQQDGSMTTKALQFERKIISDKREMFTNWYNGRIIDGAFHGKIFRKTLFEGWKLIEEIRFTEDHYNIPDICQRCRKVLISATGGYIYKYNGESAIHAYLSDFNRFGLLKSEVRICEYFEKLSDCKSYEANIYITALENAYYLTDTKFECEAIASIRNLRRRYSSNSKNTFHKILSLSVLLIGYSKGLKLVKGLLDSVYHRKY